MKHFWNQPFIFMINNRALVREDQKTSCGRSNLGIHLNENTMLPLHQGELHDMMNIGEEKADSVVIVAIEGRVDGLTAPELENRISEIVDRGDTQVLLDCAGMTYVSSAGLRIFLTGARKCQQNGGKLMICSLQPDCKSVIETSGFHTVIDCHDTREAALAAAS